jgi:hypothetical protein
VGYTYDAASRRATMTVPVQAQVVYTYDNANRLTHITQGSSSSSLLTTPRTGVQVLHCRTGF